MGISGCKKPSDAMRVDFSQFIIWFIFGSSDAFFADELKNCLNNPTLVKILHVNIVNKHFKCFSKNSALYFKNSIQFVLNWPTHDSLPSLTQNELS
jgi:hypothetical protein